MTLYEKSKHMTEAEFIGMITAFYAKGISDESKGVDDYEWIWQRLANADESVINDI